jgi:hypothetical protein
MFGLWNGLLKTKQAVHADSLQHPPEKRFGYQLQPKGGSHRGFELPQRDVPMINYPLKVRIVKKYGIITEL